MTLLSDRRALLRLAMAAAFAPAFASRAVAVGPASGGRFSPPAGPMTFTRRLERGLGDGHTLTVDRSFAIRFAPRIEGWSVSGEQVGVSVDFPRQLAALAALERQRRETNLFPLLLDGRGTIVGGPEARPAEQLDEAVATVMRLFGNTAHPVDAREEHETFVRAIHDASTRLTSLLPEQLFAPRGEPTRSERDLALPDGGEGTIEVSFTAAADPLTGLMRQARRDIVTTIAGDSRLTREKWTLAPA
jgi:ABC-type amino acid transport substrate-binding protein